MIHGGPVRPIRIQSLSSYLWAPLPATSLSEASLTVVRWWLPGQAHIFLAFLPAERQSPSCRPHFPVLPYKSGHLCCLHLSGCIITPGPATGIRGLQGRHCSGQSHAPTLYISLWPWGIQTTQPRRDQVHRQGIVAPQEEIAPFTERRDSRC